MKKFIDAIYKRNMEYIDKQLGNNNKLVECVDEYGNQPLMIAVAQGYFKLCGLLLKYGADPNFNNDEMDVMTIACYYGNKDIIELLTECGGRKSAYHNFIYDKYNPNS